MILVIEKEKKKSIDNLIKKTPEDKIKERHHRILKEQDIETLNH